MKDSDDDDDMVTERRRTRLAELLAGVRNMAEFSRVSGVQRRMLDRYKAGAEPSLDNAARIATALNVPLDALVNDVDVSVDRVILDKSVSDAVLIPVMDVVAGAGPGIENSHVDEVRRLPFPKWLLRGLGVSERRARFLMARGDSMWPTIRDGAIVLVDTGYTRAKDDGIYIVVVGEDVRIKRVKLGWNRSVTLISDNEAYSAEEVPAPDAEGLHIAGKVVWTGGEV